MGKFSLLERTNIINIVLLTSINVNLTVQVIMPNSISQVYDITTPIMICFL